MTLYHALQKLFEKYGQYGERTLNLVMPGLDGIGRMRDLMAGLRENPPAEIAGTTVATRRDYDPGVETNVQTGSQAPIELSGSNVLRFTLSDGTVAIVRPSGTEPKVKVYIMVSGETRDICNDKLKKYSQWAEDLA
jgi:phosphoglucomutase